MKSTSASRQSGAVSLFIVIIAMLLISVVTIGFLRLMIDNQSQATNSDLAQSALDSAEAGVEDAKRALIKCQNEGSACNLSEFTRCNAALADVVDSSAVASGGAGVVGEIKIQQTSNATNDALLEQAYTCVTAQLNTDDFVGTLSADTSQLVPLMGTGSFDTVTIEWFSDQDLSAGDTSLTLSPASSGKLLQSNWPVDRPPVLRMQLMQVGGTFTLSSFDSSNSANSNTNTVFMYPVRSGGIAASPAMPEELALHDVRAGTAGADPSPDGAGDTPLPINCRATLTSAGYACSASFRLPNPISGTAANRKAFLRLTPFYNGAHYRVTMTSATNPVQFKAVQPVVDSTGRANDLFRRVQSRVDMYDTSFPYPEAAVEVSGDFCKDFSVTDNTADYKTEGCTP